MNINTIRERRRAVLSISSSRIILLSERGIQYVSHTAAVLLGTE